MATDTTNRDPLHLKRLPDLDPPDELWNAIAGRLDERAGKRSDHRSGRPGWIPLAMAATVATLALCIALLRGAYGPVPVIDETAPQLARLQAVSAALESQLDDYRYGVVSATTADSVARLEQELAWLDAQITEAPNDAALWAERIALLGEINQRYIRADWRSELMLASY